MGLNMREHDQSEGNMGTACPNADRQIGTRLSSIATQGRDTGQRHPHAARGQAVQQLLTMEMMRSHWLAPSGPCSPLPALPAARTTAEGRRKAGRQPKAGRQE